MRVTITVAAVYIDGESVGQGETVSVPAVKAKALVEQGLAEVSR